MDNRVEKWSAQIEAFKQQDVYREYREAYSNKQRRKDPEKLPFTPRVTQDVDSWSPLKPVISVEKYSVRQFRGLVKAWKRAVYRAMGYKDLYIPEQFSDVETSIIKWSDAQCGWCGAKAHWKCPCFKIGYCCFDCQRHHWISQHKEEHNHLFLTLKESRGGANMDFPGEG